MNNVSLQLIEAEIKREVPPKNLISIILFGSGVKSLKKAKDFDVLIVTRKLPNKDWLVAGKIKARLLNRLEKPLDVVFMEEPDLAYDAPFLYEVSQKHRVIYGNSFRHIFQRAGRGVRVLNKRGVRIGWKVAQ